MQTPERSEQSDAGYFDNLVRFNTISARLFITLQWLPVMRNQFFSIELVEDLRAALNYSLRKCARHDEPPTPSNLQPALAAHVASANM